MFIDRRREGSDGPRREGDGRTAPRGDTSGRGRVSAVPTTPCDGLAELGADLERLIDPAGLDRPSAAPGWTIAHQVAHLEWTDRWSLLALSDPDAFTVRSAALPADPVTAIEEGAAAGARLPGPVLLDRWRTGRSALLAALHAAPAEVRVPWFGPPMRPSTLARARLMETFAHGSDVTDALGAPLPEGEWLRHVCHLGVQTRDHAFRQHGIPVPGSAFRIELRSPAGALWEWGPSRAEDGVRGAALDFALLVTRRRRPGDLTLTWWGDRAWQWRGIAQAFAGPPGPDPVARTS